MIECELVEHQPSAEGVARSHVNADEMRFQIGVGEKVLARDFTLPPFAPVVEAEEQGIERFVGRRFRIVSLEEGVAV